jgi:protease I
MVKVLMIIAPKDFRDEEFFEPKEALEGEGAEITVASRTTDEVTGMKGAKVKPDITLDQANVNEYDAVIFVGGSGTSTYFDDARALAIAKEAHEKGKKICAICIAPVILANAGVLKGKRATAWNYEGEIEKGGATYTGEPVEVDGNVVTAHGPEAARKFGQTIARELG